jgi:hypothetical protein
MSPFFHKKIARLKATVRSASIYFKTGSRGFCYDLASNPLASVGTSRNGWVDCWYIVAVTVRYANRFEAGW